MKRLNEWTEGWGMALWAIRANKLRAGLAMLGVVIGVLTVTLMGVAIDTMNRSFVRAISNVGGDVLYLQRFSWFTDSYEAWLRSSKRDPISVAQWSALERELSRASAIAPYARTQSSVSYRGRQSASVSVIGTSRQYGDTGGISVREGRFLSGLESEGGRPVCVLGATVASNLFVNSPALGQRIRLGRSSFEVIGVLDPQGGFFGELTADSAVIIPVGQFMAAFMSRPDLQIQVKAVDMARLAETEGELEAVMRKIRKLEPAMPDDFSIDTQGMLLGFFQRVSGRIASVGLFITGLSLVVGGLGIMNIMFISVAERTREIGIRKAIGATRRAILTQFLVESALLCLLGGLIAVGLAWALTLPLHERYGASVPPTVALLALAVALATGLISGFLPARRAARLNPVDALRSE